MMADSNEELREAGVPLEPELAQSQTYVEALRMLGYRFALNLADQSVEVNGYAITDITEARLRTLMRDRGVKNMPALQDAWTVAAEQNAYHPVKQYLNSLKWDGHNHIWTLTQMLESENAPVVYPDGTRMPLHGVYLYRWLIGAVAKALDGEQNPMMVWDGAQGLGKSLLARWLCPLPEYFIEGAINVQDKDSDVRLMSKWIWEVSELDATTRRADVSALKAFITKGKVTVRKSYGKRDVAGPALCSFIGTVNNSTGFLADETGSRRFYISKLTKIDWGYRKLDIEQIWAQAIHLYTVEGEKPLLTSEERAAQQAVNRNYEVETPLEDWLQLYFFLTGDETDRLTMGEIINHLRAKDIKLSGPERAQAGEVGRVLTRIGIRKKHTDRGNVWVGIALNHGG